MCCVTYHEWVASSTVLDTPGITCNGQPVEACSGGSNCGGTPPAGHRPVTSVSRPMLIPRSGMSPRPSLTICVGPLQKGRGVCSGPSPRNSVMVHSLQLLAPCCSCPQTCPACHACLYKLADSNWFTDAGRHDAAEGGMRVGVGGNLDAGWAGTVPGHILSRPAEEQAAEPLMSELPQSC